jgi:tetratricopeptide (TPR) repeat protein
LAADTETAPGQDQIWPAVRRLSNWVRETLGESMDRIERSNQQLEKVTTPSLRALQLFTEADSASRRRQWAISAQFMRQALIEDPNFASAHLWLAWALKNLHDDGWKAEAEKARALAGTVSERERYFILGSYENMQGHWEKAIPPLLALVRRYPDHFWVYGNLESAYANLGQFEQAADIAARFADARPNDASVNAEAAFFNELAPARTGLGEAEASVDVARARRYAQRAAELRPESTTPLLWVNTRLFHAHDLWMQDDAEGMLAELQRITARPEAWSDPRVRTTVTSALGCMYLTLGKFRITQKLFESLDTSIWLSMLSFFRMPAEDPNATLLPSDWQSYPKPPPLWVRAELLRLHGGYAEAVPLLQSDLDTLSRKHIVSAQARADQLATALEQSGDLQRALAVLETSSKTRNWIIPVAMGVGYGAYWLRDQARLSAYYHRLGREAETRKIDAQLRKLLAVADSDDPILRQLNGH